MPESTHKDQRESAIDALFAHNARVREQRSERRSWLVLAPISFLLLVGGAAVALAAGAFSWTDDPATTTHAAPAPPPVTTPAPAIGTAASSDTATVTAATTTASAPRLAAGRVRLSLHAVRGDSWVLVRAHDSAGRVLYTGIIRRGSTVNVSGTRLWVRFGSVGNLDLTLNGKPARPAHSGTVDAVVTPSGFQG
jgi:hypothetical protein